MSPAQTAMKGQTFAQSDLAGLSGQQGTASDIFMSVMFMSVVAGAALSIDIGISIVGAAIRPTTHPNQAKAARRWRMVNRRFPGPKSHIGGRLPSSGRSQ